MTALLAFFIVLNSLAEEQSGANLHAGTGSFVSATNSVGLPGKFSVDGSSNAVQMEHAGVLYIQDSEKKDGDGAGDSKEANKLPVLDAEEEQFLRFLNEMERIASVKRLPDAHGDVVFDFFEPLNKEGAILKRKTLKAMVKSLAALSLPTSRITCIVWATTPGPSAWNRAVQQADRVVTQLAGAVEFTEEQSQRVRAEGRPWPFSKARRPIISIMVTQVPPR